MRVVSDWSDEGGGERAPGNEREAGRAAGCCDAERAKQCSEGGKLRAVNGLL